MTVRALPAGRSRRLLRAILCMVVFGFPVLLLTFAVRQQSGAIVAFDQSVVIRAATGTAGRSGLVPVLIAVQNLTQPVVVYAVVTPVVLWAWIGPRLRGRAAWAFVTMMASWAAGAVAKVIVQRARPALDSPISHPQGYSFPSGHALNIVAAGTALLILLWPLLSLSWRRVAVVLAVIVALIVGADRILIGAHYPSDVIAGYLVGLGLTVSSWIAFVAPTAGSSSSESSPRLPASGF